MLPPKKLYFIFFLYFSIYLLLPFEVLASSKFDLEGGAKAGLTWLFWTVPLKILKEYWIHIIAGLIIYLLILRLLKH